MLWLKGLEDVVENIIIVILKIVELKVFNDYFYCLKFSVNFSNLWFNEFWE